MFIKSSQPRLLRQRPQLSFDALERTDQFTSAPLFYHAAWKCCKMRFQCFYT
ncbi:hypothetical protein BDM02DRAFT_3118494 [Thelephora ganbajun]|uniref:Uncharacterized protein n=1 Tax=Thelephora ganbajun TaxID=370292 RepID=A0ACB6Z9Z8_THEGA|nr:hypothetical protein BDM02DRAFT_3118494 [Thelephora ganbajun]